MTLSFSHINSNFAYALFIFTTLLFYNYSLLPPSTLFKIHDVSPPAHQSELGAPSVYCFIDFYCNNFLVVCLQLCLHRELPFSYIPFCSFSLPAGAILAPMLHAIQSTFSVLHRFQITMCLCLSKIEKPQQKKFCFIFEVCVGWSCLLSPEMLS